MRHKWLLLALLLTTLMAGCWDRLEIEDQLFPTTLGIDKGERRSYRMTIRVPISAALRSGILGGRSGGGETSDILTVEADNIMQGMRTLNASTARRITLRHLRGVIFSEELAREGLHDLLVEMLRNGEIHETIGVWIVRGNAHETLDKARPTGEFNPAKIAEGLLLVQKGLHMAPPIRLHHMLNRTSRIGVDPYAAVAGLNKQILGEGPPEAGSASAIAGDLDRWGTNPMEIAGTAVFRDDKLAGYLDVDETQALLAMRGEMGKAYITLPDPLKPERGMMIRFQQENLPQVRRSLTPEGPRVIMRLLFEGEVLTGDADYTDVAERSKVEQAAKVYMEEELRSVLEKLKKWEADPVGFGLTFRSMFFRVRDWERFRWRDQIGKLEVKVTAEMRLRRFGTLHTGPFPEAERGE